MSATSWQRRVSASGGPTDDVTVFCDEQPRFADAFNALTSLSADIWLHVAAMLLLTTMMATV